MVAGVLQDRVEGEGHEGCVGQGEKDFGEWSGVCWIPALCANGWDDEGDEEKNDEECGDDQGLRDVGMTLYQLTYQAMKKATVAGKAPSKSRGQGLRRTRTTVAMSMARM